MMLTILSIFVVAVLSGCVTGPGPGTKVTLNEGTGPDWCKAGTKVTTSGGIQGESTYEIKGITTYEGKSVCESEMKVSRLPGEGGTWKYYFTENNQFAVIVMKDSTGKEQKIVLNDTNPS